MPIINIRHQVEEILKSKIFLGRYLERRLLNQRIGYRDVVLLSPAEFELKRNLLAARQMLLSVFHKTHWIGISDSETLGYSSGVCILTKIKYEPFGLFWFQIRSVKFSDSEIIVALKCVRHITESYLELQPILTRVPISSVLNIPNAVIEYHLKYTCSEAIVHIKNALTLNNLKEFGKIILSFFIFFFSITAFIHFYQ